MYYEPIKMLTSSVNSYLFIVYCDSFCPLLQVYNNRYNSILDVVLPVASLCYNTKVSHTVSVKNGEEESDKSPKKAMNNNTPVLQTMETSL